MANEFTEGSAPSEGMVAQTSLHWQVFGREENQLGDPEKYEDRHARALTDLRARHTLGAYQDRQAEQLAERSREGDVREVKGHVAQEWQPVHAKAERSIEVAEFIADALWQGMCGMAKGSLNVADGLAIFQNGQEDLASLRKQHADAVQAVQRGELILERPHQYLDNWYSRWSGQRGVPTGADHNSTFHTDLTGLRRPVFPERPDDIKMPPDVAPARPRVETLEKAIQQAEKKLAEFKADLAEKIEKEERINKALTTAEAAQSSTVMGRKSDAELRDWAERSLLRR